MKRTLYIHIGAHRTATTSIQEFLKANHLALQERGYLQFNGSARHDVFIDRILRRRMRVMTAAGQLNEQADACRHDIQAIMLSDEDICTHPDLERLARFTRYFDVKIIFVMRRQDLWIESWYRQNIKWQWDADLCHLRFDEFLKQRKKFHWMDYDAILTRLEGYFGKANVLPLVFEPQQMLDGPLAAFCAALNIPDFAGLSQPKYKRNASPSPLMGEFMRNLPLDALSEDYRLIVEQACLKADWYVKQKSGPQSALFLDIEQRKSLLSEYAKGNAAVAARYFGREALFEEPLPAADAPLAPTKLPADSYELMQDYMEPFLRAMEFFSKEAMRKP